MSSAACGRAAVSIALRATLLPLGLLLGAGLLDQYGDGNGAGFVLFVGTSLAVTAFPVLARILDDRQMRRTPIGTIARADRGRHRRRAGLNSTRDRGGDRRRQRDELAATAAGAAVPGADDVGRAATSADGGGRTAQPVGDAANPGRGAPVRRVHRVDWAALYFGSFLFGVLMSRKEGLLLRATVQDRMAELNGVLLMPVFFVVAGLQVQLHFDRAGVGVLLLVLLVATAGKFLGAFGAARMHRLALRESVAIGVLMNTRGLTELIVLSVGLQLGLIDTRLYTYLVIMALVTTTMAGPLLQLLYPPDRVRRDTVPAPTVGPEREARGSSIAPPSIAGRPAPGSPPGRAIPVRSAPYEA